MIRAIVRKPNGDCETGIAVERFRDYLGMSDHLLWVDITAPEDEEVEVLLNVFGFHPLTIEDCIMPNVRSKLEPFSEYLFAIFQGIKRCDSGELKHVELDMCLGRNYLVTIHEEPIVSLDDDWMRATKKSPICSRGPDFLFYSVADSLIDGYLPLLEAVDARVDDLESKLLSESGPETLQELFNVYNELMLLRRTLAPHREILNRINRHEDLPLISPANAAYFRDIYDHLLRMSDLVDTGREVTMVLLDTHATVASYRMNEIMKTMTALATLALPLVIVTGIYGMNFQDHPWMPVAMFNVFSVMFLLSVPIMFVFFRRNKWL